MLLGIVGAGTALRTWYVLVVLEPTRLGFDASTYALQGSALLNGNGYSTPASLMAGDPTPTAGFAPLYATYQAAWQSIFGSTLTSYRLAGLLLGAVTIVLVGLLGSRLLGPRAGHVAAALVASSPTLVAVDGSVMSESLTVPLVAAAVLLGHRLANDRGNPADFVGLAAICAVAALTRQDLTLLVPLVAVPAVWIGLGHVPRGRRVLAAGSMAALVVVMVMPWIVRNERALGSATISTLSPSSALAGANCAETYRGVDLGSWRFDCVVAATPAGAPEAEAASQQRSAAMEHVRTHVRRLPLVIAARQARVWSVWDPRELARRDADESRRYGWQVVSRPLDVLTAVAGAAGLAVIVRRRSTRGAWLVIAPLVIVVVSATLSYGNPRFAAIAHPSSALGIAALLMTASSRLRVPCPPQPEPDPLGVVEP